MSKTLIEGVFQIIKEPDPDILCDNMYFLGIDSQKCNGCGECAKECPTKAIYGEAGIPHSIAHPEPCIHCGSCLQRCPVSAVHETVSWLDKVKEKLADPDCVVVAMPAPMTRYAFGEVFGIGRRQLPKMISVFKMLGFDYCWDIEFAADVAIWEEGMEFLKRLEKNENIPLFTACCSSWKKYAEMFYPDLLRYFSRIKSPTAINGRLAKTYAAEKYGLDPEKIYTVAITPCISKKYEALRPELSLNNMRDIDAALTIREFIHFAREARIDFSHLHDGKMDGVMGEASGASTLFGVTGGVIESLLRYLGQYLQSKEMETWDLKNLRGTGNMKECRITLNGREILAAAVHGAKNFEHVCEVVRSGKSPYHLIEFMACPGGCACGPGSYLMDEKRGLKIAS